MPTALRIATASCPAPNTSTRLFVRRWVHCTISHHTVENWLVSHPPRVHLGSPRGTRSPPAGPSPPPAAPLLAPRPRRATYWIPAGGSCPTGTIAYVSAAFEPAAQIRAGLCPAFDEIYVAIGSSGTAAGLWG